MMLDKRLINLCSESKKYVKLTVLMNWISMICNASVIILLGKFINCVYKEDKVNLIKYTSLVISILIIRFICNIYYSKFSYLSSAKSRSTLRELIYKKLLDLGPNYNKTYSTSTIVQLTGEGVETLENYFGRYLPQFFYSMLAPITLFFILSFISIKVALILIICVPLIPISIVCIMKIAKKIFRNYWNIYSDLGETFLENLQGLTTLKIFNRDEERHEKMNKDAENFRRITMKVLSMQLNSINVMDFIAFGGAALGSIVALNEFKNGNVSLGGVLIIILLSSEFFIPLRLLGSFFHVSMNGIAASEKIFKILDSEVENEQCSFKKYLRSYKNLGNNLPINERCSFKSMEEKNKKISIKLENVDFGYDKHRKVLSNVNLSMYNGEFVAIVGESGSGKSTIASLILKNYGIDKGNIKINDLEYKDIYFKDICKKISLISTNSYIFNGTILENLLIAKKDATREEIENALKVANLYDFVEALPNGLKTKVGEGGSLLSGGQKQRLALARTILGNRDMIIFDEATSNIDVESEEKIWQAIYKLSKEKTILVISHRLANVKNADKIYVLDKGKVVEKGSHIDLYEQGSYYYDMLIKQQALEALGGA
ncbi:cysteine ABC transporter ATP-binding protein [Clostridium botulinum]|uniref:Cysteine ABC transporter ATP-binding protein n=1 Tax=Clostridium botulinum TaxID=1491 RepID=A0ABC8CTL2_CLOBO|nr:ABC transporter ATP-binding protein/permease [Clostridium botulinum]AVQ38786.1 cysteine ABC transporter ATP-binding protein [Clostridium botulinum]